MAKTFIVNLFKNKKNGQISLVLPKRKFKKFKEQTPKQLKLKIEEIIWNK